MMEKCDDVTFSEEETVGPVPQQVKPMAIRNSHLYYLTPHLNGQWFGGLMLPPPGMAFS